MHFGNRASRWAKTQRELRFRFGRTTSMRFVPWLFLGVSKMSEEAFMCPPDAKLVMCVISNLFEAILSQ